MPPIKFSVIIPTWNRPETIERSFPVLRDNTDWTDGELIIIEQGSSQTEIPVVVENQNNIGVVYDEVVRTYVAKFLDTFWGRYKLVQNGENLGIPRAWNQGLRIAEGEVLICTASDMLLPVGWVGELYRLLSLPGAGNVAISCDPNILKQLGNKVLLNGSEITLDDAHDAGWNVGTIMCFRRALHQRIGYFFEGFGKYGEEDFDWGYRTLCSGLHNYYSARLLVESIGGHDTIATNPEKAAGFEERRKMAVQRCAGYDSKSLPLYVPWYLEDKSVS